MTNETIVCYNSWVSGFAKADLGYADNEILNPSSGLIATTVYGTATTATTTVPGDVLGKVKSRGLQEGSTGSVVPQSEGDYFFSEEGQATCPAPINPGVEL